MGDFYAAADIIKFLGVSSWRLILCTICDLFRASLFKTRDTYGILSLLGEVF